MCSLLKYPSNFHSYVLGSLGCYNRTLYWPGCLNNWHLFPTAPKAGSLRSGCQRGWGLGEGSPPSWQTTQPLTVSSMTERRGEALGRRRLAPIASLKNISPFVGAPLSWSGHLPKAMLPNTITLQIWAPTREYGRGTQAFSSYHPKRHDLSTAHPEFGHSFSWSSGKQDGRDYASVIPDATVNSHFTKARTGVTAFPAHSSYSLFSSHSSSSSSNTPSFPPQALANSISLWCSPSIYTQR